MYLFTRTYFVGETMKGVATNYITLAHIFGFTITETLQILF